MNETPPGVHGPPGQSPRRVARRWASFYGGFFHDLRDNLAVLSPLIAVFALVVAPGSAGILCAFECGGSVRDFWEAAYVTWQAMTTSGAFGDLTPRTLPGRILVSIDALIGYALLGVFVFMIARSAEKEGKVHDE